MFCLFLVQVPGDGNCLYSAIRRSTLAPAQYSNQHLKRQLAMFLALNAELLFPLCKVHLMGSYGIAEEGHGGPFTFIEYIESVLQPGEEGDLLVLYLLSLMWQIQVTVVVAQPLPAQIRLRHDQELKSADLVVVYNGTDHYTPAGTSTPLGFAATLII